MTEDLKHQCRNMLLELPLGANTETVAPGVNVCSDVLVYSGC